MGQLLGRASVAALSFISGYLLIRTASGRSLTSVARRRFQTLIIPMLTWNLIFCILQIGKVVITGKADDSILLRPDSNLLAALTGLTGPPANLSLFFLRDLFVSALLIQAVRPILNARAWLVLGVLAVVTVFDLAAPVIFRPSILFFVAAGAIYARRSATLSDQLSGRTIVVVTVLLAASLLVVAYLLRKEAGPMRELEDLFAGLFLVILVLVTSAVIAGTRAAARILPIERRISKHICSMCR